MPGTTTATWRAGEVAEHLGGAAVAGRVEEQEVAVGVVELAQLAQARVVLAHPGVAQAAISSRIASALAR